MSWRTHLLAGAVALALASVGSDRIALADDTVDTVELEDGGRVHGTIVNDDPEKGVSIQLSDGTTRRIKRAEVKTVRYATAAAPRPHTHLREAAPTEDGDDDGDDYQPRVIHRKHRRHRAPPPEDSDDYDGPRRPRRYDEDGYPIRRSHPGRGAIVTGAVFLTLGSVGAAVGALVLGFEAADGHTSLAPGGVTLGISGTFMLVGVICLAAGSAAASEARSDPAVTFVVGPSFSGFVGHF